MCHEAPRVRDDGRRASNHGVLEFLRGWNLPGSLPGFARISTLGEGPSAPKWGETEQTQQALNAPHVRFPRGGGELTYMTGRSTNGPTKPPN